MVNANLEVMDCRYEIIPPGEFSDSEKSFGNNAATSWTMLLFHFLPSYNLVSKWLCEDVGLT